MEPEEIDAKIAIQVMGWRKEFKDWIINEGGSRVHATHWNPSQNPDDAVLVLEHLKSMEPSISWNDEQAVWLVTFFKGAPLISEAHEDFAMAVCLGALAVCSQSLH